MAIEHEEDDSAIEEKSVPLLTVLNHCAVGLLGFGFNGGVIAIPIKCLEVPLSRGCITLLGYAGFEDTSYVLLDPWVQRVLRHVMSLDPKQ